MASPRSGSTGTVEAKGDILGFNGVDLERLPAGATGSILRADPLQPLGLKWDVPDDIPGIGIPIAFGATFSALAQQGRYHKVNGEPDSANDATLAAVTQAIVLKSGTITRFGWNTVTATAATVYKIWKNGLVVATINLTGVSGVLTGSFSTVVMGDVLAVEYDAGPFPGNSQVQIFIE